MANVDSQESARIQRTFLVRELIMRRPPKSPASLDQIEKFKAARPRPINQKKPRGRHVEASNVDAVMRLVREKYKAGAYEIRSMNAAPAEKRDGAKAIVVVYLQPRRS